MKKLNLNKIAAIVFLINVLLTTLFIIVKMGHFGMHLISIVLGAGAAISSGVLMALVLFWLISNVITLRK